MVFVGIDPSKSSSAAGAELDHWSGWSMGGKSNSFGVSLHEEGLGRGAMSVCVQAFDGKTWVNVVVGNREEISGSGESNPLLYPILSIQTEHPVIWVYGPKDSHRFG